MCLSKNATSLLIAAKSTPGKVEKMSELVLIQRLLRQQKKEKEMNKFIFRQAHKAEKIA